MVLRLKSDLHIVTSLPTNVLSVVLKLMSPSQQPSTETKNHEQNHISGHESYGTNNIVSICLRIGRKNGILGHDILECTKHVKESIMNRWIENHTFR